MSGLRKIAEIPAGSWTKWVVVGFWVVVLVLALPLSSKLTGAEKNDAKTADAIRAIAGSNANGLTPHLTGPLTTHITGPLGINADLSNVFGGTDTTLLFSTVAVVVLILLITYRSPFLWLLPVISSGGGADHRPGGDLPAGRAHWPDGHRAKRRHRVCVGVRCQH